MRTLEELYRAYRDDVYRYLYSLTRDAAQAEDLLSETFLQALQNAASYRGEAGEKDLAVRYRAQPLAARAAQAPPHRLV